MCVILIYLTISGILREQWLKVKIDGHVAAVLEAIKNLEHV
ncbi:hypothetical protein [Candidatus Venteria ishoeyi]|nr:hypothetical protein [Candidatus Venteria ishoeyi]